MTSSQLAPLILSNEGQPITVDMPSALVVNDTDAIIDAALQGLGIGRTVLPLVEHLIEEGRLIPVLKKHWFKYPGLSIYFPQKSQELKRIRVTLDFWIDRFKTDYRL